MSVAPTPVRQTPHGAPVLIGVAVALAVVVALLGTVLFGGSSSPSLNEGSGQAMTEARTVAPFTGVTLAGTNNLIVRVGGAQSVVVRADDNVVSHVTTRVLAGRLVVGNTHGSFSGKTPMTVTISVPRLDNVTLGGSGTIALTGIDTNRLTVSIGGNGVVHASGSADRLDVALAGTGDAELRGLTAKAVRVTVTGSGHVVVTATRRLDAAVPGTGSIGYAGDPPHVTTSITGTGAITPV